MNSATVQKMGFVAGLRLQETESSEEISATSFTVTI